MLTYCVKQRNKTKCVPGGETFVFTENGRNAMKCQWAECGITKFRFVSTGMIQKGGAPYRRRGPSQARIHTGFLRFPENGQKFQNIKRINK